MKIKNYLRLMTLSISLSTILFSCSNVNEDNIKLYPVYSGSSYGYVDKSGKIVINPQFDYAGLFYDGIAMVGQHDEKGMLYGYINSKGEIIVNIQYPNATPFSEGYAFVTPKGGQITAISKNGKTAFEVKFADKIFPFKDGLAAFYTIKDGKRQLGFIDKKGKIAIEPNSNMVMPYDECGFSEGLCVVKRNDKFGFIDKKGKVVIPYQFDEVKSFKYGKACFRNGRDWGIIDKTGKIIVNAQFEEIIPDNKDLFIIQNHKGKIGWCDANGKIKINPQFDMVRGFGENDLAPFSNGDKFGYVDKSGKITINAQYDKALSFHNGIALVFNDGWGMIDSKGQYICNPQFESISEDLLQLDSPGNVWSVTTDHIGLQIIERIINLDPNYKQRFSDLLKEYNLTDVKGFEVQLLRGYYGNVEMIYTARKLHPDTDSLGYFCYTFNNTNYNANELNVAQCFNNINIGSQPIVQCKDLKLFKRGNGCIIIQKHEYEHSSAIQFVMIPNYNKQMIEYMTESIKQQAEIDKFIDEHTSELDDNTSELETETMIE